MKKLLVFVSALLVSISAFADGEKTVVRCQSANSDQVNYFVSIEQQRQFFEATLRRAGEKGDLILARYDVIRIPPALPGGPLKFVSQYGESFTLSICATCTPVDGKSSATLSAEIPKERDITNNAMLCQLSE